jgi:hypothetical protein
MKTVFILGAGASKQAGAPLMADFLDRAAALHRSNATAGNDVARTAFEDVFNAISELQGIYAKSYLDIDNIETLFGAIEMAQIINKFGRREQASIANLRDSIITLIVHTLELSIQFPVSEEHVYPPAPYGDFVEMVHDLSEQQNRSEPMFSFITFNYDLALDFALYHHARIGFTYWLPLDADARKYPYLKLHGSINWGKCQGCDEIIPRSFNEIKFSHFFLRRRNHHIYSLGSKITEAQHCGKPLKNPPVLVPPTWNKTGYHQGLTCVWSKAAEVLAEAENIFVIGYSLPETDSFFRYLFALGSESDTRIKRLWVFNPDGNIESRFDDMIGRGIKNRFKFIGGNHGRFDQAIPAIREELQRA